MPHSSQLRSSSPARNARSLQRARPQAFIDNPRMNYAKLYRAAGGIDAPLGRLPPGLDIAVVGLGASGAFACAQLTAGGAAVTAYEQAGEPGGRFMSQMVGSKNVYELGGMRFPPSEALTYMLAEARGFTFLPDFPDPGKVFTLIFQNGSTCLWTDPNKGPDIAPRVANGFLALIMDGIRKGGFPFLEPLADLQTRLASDDLNVRKGVEPDWQAWLDAFHGCSLIRGLRAIFGAAGEWDVPGGECWTNEDFVTFGNVGIGSGGLRDLFDRDFCGVMLIIPNGFMSDQATFAEFVNGVPAPAPIQKLVGAQWHFAEELGAKGHFNASVEGIEVLGDEQSPRFRLAVRHDGGLLKSVEHDIVIVTTTIRVAEKMKLAESRGVGKQLFSDKVCKAMRNLDLIASTKLFNLIPKLPAHFPRVLETDRVPGQIYTLAYNDDEMVALEDYAWNTGSLAVEELSAEELHDMVVDTARKATKGTAYSDYPQRLAPVRPGVLVKKDWQTDPAFLGAFVLPAVGQKGSANELVHDFLKARRKGALPIFGAGDTWSHISGWGDAAFESVTNVASAIYYMYGELFHRELSPVYLMDKSRFRY